MGGTPFFQILVFFLENYKSTNNREDLKNIYDKYMSCIEIIL